MRTRSSQSGFSLIELIIALGVFLAVSAGVMDGISRFTKVNGMIANRTEMHSGVRNATELLQQEVGQAGRISLPAAVTLSGAVAAGSATVVVNSVDNMFVGEQLVIDTGSNQETVTLTAVNTSTKEITATFVLAHATSTPVTVQGAFASGVVPKSMTSGSTDNVLKIYGDINGDGSMVYVEFTCDTAAGNLYRNSMSISTVTKPTLTVSKVLLNNITANPGGAACFTYQQRTVNFVDYVVDVAITLTVQTAYKDPITGLFQKETKALLNVAPRNVFNAWLEASQGLTNRVQSMPASVTNLLGQ
jgi:prepilin-type N-terminal cleavage/methylation domain-containing protein